MAWGGGVGGEAEGVRGADEALLTKLSGITRGRKDMGWKEELERMVQVEGGLQA